MNNDPHDCNYDVRAVHHEYRAIDRTITRVLKVCMVCGSITTESVEGKWTLDEIKGG